MFDFREKLDLLSQLFGVYRRNPGRKRYSDPYGALRVDRPEGFSDEEIGRAIGHIPTHYGERQYICFNGAVPTTAAQVKMACTTSINTLQQVLSVTGKPITILEWGISFDNTAAGVPVNVEFFSNDVAATAGTSVTPTPFGVDTTASACVGGTGATMFNDGAITEGTVANARMYDCQLVPPTGSYWKQWPLGREPCMAAAKALRVRVTAPAAVNAISYVVWAE